MENTSDSNGDKEDCFFMRKKERLEREKGDEGDRHYSPSKSRTSTEAANVLEDFINVALHCDEGQCDGIPIAAQSDGGARLRSEPTPCTPTKKARKGKGKGQRDELTKSESSSGAGASAGASAGHHYEGGACGVSVEGKRTPPPAATKAKSKRQRLLQKAGNSDFSEYSAESFLKAKPTSHFYSPSNSNGNCSKE